MPPTRLPEPSDDANPPASSGALAKRRPGSDEAPTPGASFKRPPDGARAGFSASAPADDVLVGASTSASADGVLIGASPSEGVLI